MSRGRSAVTPTADADIESQIEKLKKGTMVTGFECRDCGADFGDTRPDRCPKCGSYAIRVIS